MIVNYITCINEAAGSDAGGKTDVQWALPAVECEIGADSCSFLYIYFVHISRRPRRDIVSPITCKFKATVNNTSAFKLQRCSPYKDALLGPTLTFLLNYVSVLRCHFDA